MDTVAAIQAAKQQLEADRTKKAQYQVAETWSRSFHNTFNNNDKSNNHRKTMSGGGDGLYPPATTTMRAGGFAPGMNNVIANTPHTNKTTHNAASELSGGGPRPPISIWGQTNNDGEEDNDDDCDSITSSLSGTLPGDIRTPSATMTTATTTNTRVVAPALTRDHLLELSQLQQQGLVKYNEDVRTNNDPFKINNSNSNNNNNNNNNKKPMDFKSMIEALNVSASQYTPPPKTTTSSLPSSNKMGTIVNSSYVKSNISVGSNGGGGGGGGGDDAARRIEEIMTAYQGKVDTILNKPRGPLSESTIAAGEGGNTTTAGTTDAFFTPSTTTTLTTSSKTTGLLSSSIINSASKSSGIATTVTNNTNMNNNDDGGVGGESKIDDILSTYKKRVGEIMSKKLTTPATAESTPTAIIIVPTMVGGDTAIMPDYSNRKGGSEHSPIGEENIYNDNYDEVGSGNNNDDENNDNEYINDDEDINSHDSREEDSREGGYSRDGRTSSVDGDSDEGVSQEDSYISGASSASDAEDKCGAVAAAAAADRLTTTPAEVVSLRQKSKSFNSASIGPKVDVFHQSHDDISSAMTKGRLELLLVEAREREEELYRENRRLEENCNTVKSQLDTVQAEARSTKYSSSEQVSRINDLERKLKNETERVNELERERDSMKEEYEQDLEEQKDINRQLEQMVMSEEFENELEDEINQVKELEHINRRFKVKIEMLEREKSAYAKKYEVKIEELEKKVTSLKKQLVESDKCASQLEEEARHADEIWEGTIADEKRHSRDIQDELDKAQTKIQGMEVEVDELRDYSTKIDEYERVLGKLMERNDELEEDVLVAKNEVKLTRDELDMTNRQVELLDRRRAVKVKDFEEKIEEQRIVIEQQQETLDESVKTILKLYSLNNTRGDDLSVVSEEKLTDMARAIVPRLGTNRSTLPPIMDEDHGESLPTLVSSSRHADRRTATPMKRRQIRPTVTSNSTRGKELTEEVKNLLQRPAPRARSTGRTQNRFEGKNLLQTNQTRHGEVSRARSNGRGPRDRFEGIPPPNRQPRRSSSLELRNLFEYDPTGPASLSRALVSIDSGDVYGRQSPPSRSNYHRELTAASDDRDRDRGATPYSESTMYNHRLTQSAVNNRAPRNHQNQRDRRYRLERDEGFYRNDQQRDRERNRGRGVLNDPVSYRDGGVSQDKDRGYRSGSRPGGGRNSARHIGGNYWSDGATHTENNIPVPTSSRRAAGKGEIPRSTSEDVLDIDMKGYNNGRYPSRGRIRDP